MSLAALDELDDLLRQLAHRDDVSVIVLTGGVPGYFIESQNDWILAWNAVRS